MIAGTVILIILFLLSYTCLILYLFYIIQTKLVQKSIEREKTLIRLLSKNIDNIIKEDDIHGSTQKKDP